MKCLAFLVVGIALPVSAQWTATILHPAGSPESVGRGASSVQVGASSSHAALWTGSAASIIDLHPTGVGASSSIAYASALSQQAGVVTYGFTDHAAIWTGTAASCVDLNPSGIGQSRIYGTDGFNQAGQIDVGAAHATVWSSTPLSYVDIHPAAAVASTAQDVQGFNITGYSVYPAAAHASVWATSLHLHTDLHPTGYANSFGWTVNSTQQGGQATLGATPHAALWTGTAASFVDLHPLGYTGSEIRGMDDGVQCGWASKSGKNNAGVWFGTPGSFVDLQSVMPADYSNSQAFAVWTDGSMINVVGYADHATTTGTRIEAVLWTTTIPEPCAMILLIAVASLSSRSRFAAGRRPAFQSADLRSPAKPDQ